MDFAFDFQPLNAGNEMNINMKKEDMMNNPDFANQNNQNKTNDQQPLAYLPFTNDEVKNKEIINQQVVPNVNPGVMPDNKVNNDIDQLVIDTTNIIQNLKVISKKVEIITKITYTYEDGSTKVVTQNETHEFKN